MFNLLFCIVDYIFVGASASPHLKMGVLDARDSIKDTEVSGRMKILEGTVLPDGRIIPEANTVISGKQKQKETLKK